MKLQVDKSWDSMLGEQFQSDYFKELLEFLHVEYEQQTIFPERENIFRALNETPYDKVKAVILGQDPYHGEGQAQGLSFSVQPGVKLPPSLRNIYIELQDDINCPLPENGSLVKWAKEGVLLLNTVLTVRKGEPASHAKKGWEMFTDEIIKKLDQRNQPIVFILWGKHAQQKKQLINPSKHFVIESAHPSPFSARKGFFGSKPFSKTNDYLHSQNIEKIDWSL
jgi:uracil-DNA glycosylase